ncbi:MAG TPA: GNAT family N-acetyltransferase [Roseiflexaceae bacterium]|nr:GNAT family N-acetyltransferase [Roseiflexaceae bacterium]
MTADISFVPASQLSLDGLAALLTRSFEGYFYTILMDSVMLSRRIRTEQLDLHASTALLVDGEPAGLGLVGIRGDRSWCGGFGVAAAFRGRGLAGQLCEAMLRRAREDGAKTMTLEVLTRNTRALRTYQRAGMRISRDLLLLRWQADPGQYLAAPDGPPIEAIDAERALAQYVALHSERAPWQRDLPTLLSRGGIWGLALPDPAEPPYLLYTADAGGARILDIGARRPEQAARLLGALQESHAEVLCINEPANSSLLPVYLQRGFVETDRQHELEIELK